MCFQSFLRLAKSSQPWMFCTMSSRAKNIEHGRRSTSPSCSSTWSSAWIYGRATWPRRVSTSTRTSASRYVRRNLWCLHRSGFCLHHGLLESRCNVWLYFQVNIKSLEDVVRAYLKLAEEKTETAKEESQQMVLDIEDLDNIQTPERWGCSNLGFRNYVSLQHLLIHKSVYICCFLKPDRESKCMS